MENKTLKKKSECCNTGALQIICPDNVVRLRLETIQK